MRLLNQLFCLWPPLVVTLMLTGCSQRDGDSPSVIEYARTALPDDPQLADIYQRSCQTCHGDPAAGAPLTGHSGRWKPLLDKGMPALIANVTGGIGGMPPYGLCMDCTQTEFRALIDFMASHPAPGA